jgi:prepilin-type processing-associated H-X9-DG protein
MKLSNCKKQMALAASLDGQIQSRACLSAFSLLELIVVLGVLFLVAAVLLPALSIARQKTQSERCLNNLHQLTTAWLMYASANNDRCVNNFGINGVSIEISEKTYDTWCLDNMDWTSSSGNTNVSLLKLGQLTPYLDADMMRFKCPADRYLSPGQVAAGFKYRVRSYSMSAFFGLFSNGKEGPDSTFQGKNYFDPDHRQFIKVTDVAQPSSMFLFLEEHPDSINDGYFDVGNIPYPITPTTMGEFLDVPASFHHGSCNFSFSDGHVELHQWQDPRANGQGIAGLPVKYAQQDGISDPRPYSDIQWVWTHSSIPFSNH